MEMLPVDGKLRSILQIIGQARQAMPSTQLVLELRERGLEMSERSIRLYLEDLETRGLVQSHGRKGRTLSAAGRVELDSARLADRAGYLLSRIDSLVYRMDFDLDSRAGSVIINTTILKKDDVLGCLDAFMEVFAKGYAMGTMIGLLPPGSATDLGTVPAGHVGLCTVCSVSLNGVLKSRGIPMRSLFSGLLELSGGMARRFVDLIYYEGTTIDPLELFIRAKLTDYLGAIRDGNGKIGAGYREIPAESYERVQQLSEKLSRIGLGAFANIGRPNETLLNIPVHDGSCGVIVVGGLNPVAVFEESGVRTQARALSGLMPYDRLFPWTELPARLGAC